MWFSAIFWQFTYLLALQIKNKTIWIKIIFYTNYKTIYYKYNKIAKTLLKPLCLLYSIYDIYH